MNPETDNQPPISPLPEPQPQTVSPQFSPPTPQVQSPYPTQPTPPYSQPPQLTTPSSWNTLFILALVFDVLWPIIGLIIGEVLYRKAKAAGNDMWRKKARKAINFGCLMLVIFLVVIISRNIINAKHNTPQSSDAFYSKLATQPSGKDGNPSDTQVKLNWYAIESAIDGYDSNPNLLPSKQGGFLSYPTLEQLQDAAWRDANGVKIDASAFTPNSIGKTLTFISSTPTKYDQFGYVPQPADCQDTAVSPCTSYTITAKKSSGVLTEKSYDFSSN